MYRHQKIVLLAIILTAAIDVSPSCAEDWPGWRGPRGDGSSLETNVPTHWNATENIAWKVPLPGTGHASPVIWQDRLFLVWAVEEREQRVLGGFDRRTGELLWQQVVVTAPLEDKHGLNSYASSTPATDGELLYVAFLDRDSMLVAAYDFDGRQQWLVRPGPFASKHGFCSCPVLFEDLVIVNGDHDGESYVVALDRATGETRWKIDRANHTRSYSTPLVREIDGRTQMILSGNKCVASYDPRDGRQHWIIDGPTEQFVATCVYGEGLIFMTCGFPDYHILAIRPDGEGNVTDSHIAWRETKGASYVPSPIFAGSHFLLTADGGVASCFQATSGDRVWMKRLGSHYSGSPVTAGGLVYFTDDEGITKVIRPGAELEVVAENSLGESCYSSPAISQGNLFIRGEKHLYCIGPRPQ
ncbi:MAG: PQQ-binding-like beta-propeller repeat protein [Pirellulales bacterium]|nr:PQQ-binding-like beta-propeller repeat protein [Pirellulales bacterium]